MIVIIFKAILSSGLFLLAYKLLLEKEKMYEFNRFYLLFSLVLSFAIPFLVIEINAPAPVLFENTQINTEITRATLGSKPLTVVGASNGWPSILWSVYGIVTFLFLIRFVINLRIIRNRILTATVRSFKNVRLVLLDEKIAPHSFLNYIFVSREDYDKRTIEEEILDHELAHAKQKHSLDVLAIELAQIICWFNPFIILYKKVIQLNHEFLADEQVVRSNHNVGAYLQLLVSKSSGQTSLPFMSPFNYLVTKKRLIMMTKTTSNRKALAKQAASLFLFDCAILFLSSKTYSQSKTDANTGSPSPLPAESQSKQDSINFGPVYGTKDQNGKPILYRILGADDKYMYLTKSGEYYKLVGLHATKPMAKGSPTNEQLQAWKNEKMYGVWLDGKRIENEELSKYQPADISSVFESRLEKNAKNYGKHYYQVNLMTNKNYEEYLENWKSRKPYVPDPNKTWQVIVRQGSWNDVKDHLK